MKSVAIVGASNSSRLVKDTPAEQIWTLNLIGMLSETPEKRDKYPFVPDLLLDIHTDSMIREPMLGDTGEKYWEWLQQPHGYPILMQKKDSRFPSSEEYPRKEVKALFPSNVYVDGKKVELSMASSVDWLFGLAVLYGVEDIYLYGCRFGNDTEYRYQVGGNYFFSGMLNERGIRLHVPKNDIFFFEQADYGYVAWVRVPIKEIRRMKGELEFSYAHAEGHNKYRYSGAIKVVDHFLDWARGKESVGREAMQSLETQLKKEHTSWIALNNDGDPEALPNALEKEGGVRILQHFIRVCDLVPSELDMSPMIKVTGLEVPERKKVNV